MQDLLDSPQGLQQIAVKLNSALPVLADSGTVPSFKWNVFQHKLPLAMVKLAAGRCRKTMKDLHIEKPLCKGTRN
jgi:hypothetical protein